MPFSTYLPEHMGSIRLTPSGPFVAGSYAELTLTYTAGTFGIDDTGMVKISWRTTSDMSKPQFDKPAAANFTTVEASNGAKLEVWFDRLNIRPWANTLLIRVGRGYLRAGDTLTVRLGDRRRVRPAFGCRPIARSASSSRTSIDAFATYEFTELPEQPASRWCRAGGALEGDLALARRRRRAVPAGASLPRTCGAIRPADADQVLTLVPSRPVRGLPDASPIKRGDGPLRAGNLVADAPAISICVMADGEELARANPLRVVAAAPLRRYWGDLHGQSGETIGMGNRRKLFPLCARPGLHRHRRPPGQRLPDHRRVLGRAQPADRRIRRAGPLRLPARLRMVGQHRHGRRPQHLLPPRGPPDPPLVAHPGRGPDLDRRRSTPRMSCSRARRRGRRGHRACRRALRRSQLRP